jgi:hypothetical protein
MSGRRQSWAPGTLRLAISVVILAISMTVLAMGTAATASPSVGRFAATNMNWLGWDSSTGTYPTHAEIDAGLAEAKAEGFTVIRAQTLGVSVGRPDSIEPSLGVFNNAAFDPIDYTIMRAQALGLSLIIPLTDEWRYTQGGHWQFVHWAYLNGVPGVQDTLSDLSQTTGNNGVEKAREQQFYTNPTIVGYFDNYVQHLLTHVNAYTGVTIGDSPSVLAFESGNELFDSAASQGCACSNWTENLAVYVKSLSRSGMLFIDGSASSGLGVANANGLTAPAVDWIDAHYYGSYETPANLAADAAVAQAHNKELFVGEYDWLGDTTPLSTWLSAIGSTPDVIGDAPWDELPLVNGVPECFSDGYGFYYPATASGCPDTPSQSTQAAALSLWAQHAVTMAGSTPGGSANLIASSALQQAAPSSLVVGTANGSAPSLACAGTLVMATSATQFWVYGGSPSAGAPVSPGQTYTVRVTVSRGAQNASLTSATPALSWSNGSGNWVSTSSGSVVALPSDGSSTVLTLTATAPASAAFALPQVQTSQSATVGDSLVISGFTIVSG